MSHLFFPFCAPKNCPVTQGFASKRLVTEKTTNNLRREECVEAAARFSDFRAVLLLVQVVDQ
jgi:hypothetical protein